MAPFSIQLNHARAWHRGAYNEWNFPAIGEGEIDMPMVFEILKEHNNMCPLSIEIEFTPQGPKNLEEVNQAVKTSYEYLKAHGFEI